MSQPDSDNFWQVLWDQDKRKASLLRSKAIGDSTAAQRRAFWEGFLPIASRGISDGITSPFRIEVFRLRTIIVGIVVASVIYFSGLWHTAASSPPGIYTAQWKIAGLIALGLFLVSNTFRKLILLLVFAAVIVVIAVAILHHGGGK